MCAPSIVDAQVTRLRAALGWGFNLAVFVASTWTVVAPGHALSRTVPSMTLAAAGVVAWLIMAHS